MLGERCKWYDHDDHMRELSRQYPDVLFTLHGEGEAQDDLWRKYYKGGLRQLAVVELKYDEFDPEKLVCCSSWTTSSIRSPQTGVPGR